MSQTPGQLQPPQQGGNSAHDPRLRTIDLGREGHLVTWQEWFARTAQLMAASVAPEQRNHLHFRVTLKDSHIPYAIRRVMTHIARGACYPDESRWSERVIAGARTLPEAAGTTEPVVGTKGICNIITGYMLQGFGPDMKPTTLSVTPCQIASVECVLSEPKTSGEPFGFAAFHTMKEDQAPEMEEVEETVPIPEVMPPTFTGPGLSVETAPADS